MKKFHESIFIDFTDFSYYDRRNILKKIFGGEPVRELLVSPVLLIEYDSFYDFWTPLTGNIYDHDLKRDFFLQRKVKEVVLILGEIQ